MSLIITAAPSRGEAQRDRFAQPAPGAGDHGGRPFSLMPVLLVVGTVSRREASASARSGLQATARRPARVVHARCAVGCVASYHLPHAAGLRQVARQGRTAPCARPRRRSRAARRDVGAARAFAAMLNAAKALLNERGLRLRTHARIAAALPRSRRPRSLQPRLGGVQHGENARPAATSDAPRSNAGGARAPAATRAAVAAAARRFARRHARRYQLIDVAGDSGAVALAAHSSTTRARRRARSAGRGSAGWQVKNSTWWSRAKAPSTCGHGAGALGVEVDQHVVEHQRQDGAAAGELGRQAEAQAEVELFERAAAELAADPPRAAVARRPPPAPRPRSSCTMRGVATAGDGGEGARGLAQHGRLAAPARTPGARTLDQALGGSQDAPVAHRRRRARSSSPPTPARGSAPRPSPPGRGRPARRARARPRPGSSAARAPRAPPRRRRSARRATRHSDRAASSTVASAPARRSASSRSRSATSRSSARRCSSRRRRAASSASSRTPAACKQQRRPPRPRLPPRPRRRQRARRASQRLAQPPRRAAACGGSTRARARRCARPAPRRRAPCRRGIAAATEQRARARLPRRHQRLDLAQLARRGVARRHRRPAPLRAGRRARAPLPGRSRAAKPARARPRRPLRRRRPRSAAQRGLELAAPRCLVRLGLAAQGLQLGRHAARAAAVALALGDRARRGRARPASSSSGVGLRGSPSAIAPPRHLLGELAPRGATAASRARRAASSSLRSVRRIA